ncbi:hypothetical protein HON22_03460 [Candidatus Peregrinibacteria bacterium]|jgi:hypothetical protein|nr:hypothetical protein [Candidatus Peregrinibacteria bacterium]
MPDIQRNYPTIEEEQLDQEILDRAYEELLDNISPFTPFDNISDWEQSNVETFEKKYCFQFILIGEDEKKEQALLMNILIV